MDETEQDTNTTRAAACLSWFSLTTGLRDRLSLQKASSYGARFKMVEFSAVSHVQRSDDLRCGPAGPAALPLPRGPKASAHLRLDHSRQSLRLHARIFGELGARYTRCHGGCSTPSLFLDGVGNALELFRQHQANQIFLQVGRHVFASSSRVATGELFKQGDTARLYLRFCAH